MARPTNKFEFIDYCKRRLGAPVIEINVDDDQVDDRVDEAIQMYRKYHSDGTMRTYFTYQLTANDIQYKYIEFASDSPVLEVIRVFPIRAGTTSRNFFDFKYQFMLNDMSNFTSLMGDMAYYNQVMQYVDLMDMQLTGTPQVQWSTIRNQLHFYGDIDDGDLKAGDYILIEAYVIHNENPFTRMWDDQWLKAYATALIQQQWGQNLIKFDGMQMPGGVTLNGRQILEDANNQIDKLMEELRLNHEMPIDFYVG